MDFLKELGKIFMDQNIVEIIKNWFNILFFIITGTITILTYIKARKSILQPIKTEIFKQQLEVFSEIMDIFNGKNEMQIRRFFAFDKLEFVNVVKMIDGFAGIFFEFEFDIEKRPYNTNDCKTTAVMKDVAHKYLKIDVDPVIELIASTSDEISNKPTYEIKVDIWKEYEYGIISIPNEYIEAVEKIDKIIKSPLLPKECIKYLSEIKKIAEDNITILSEVLREVFQELPEKYTNTNDLLNISLSWIGNRYNDKFISFIDTTDELINYLRDYFKVDELLK